MSKIKSNFRIRTAGLVLLLAAISILAVQLILVLRAHERMSTDAAELNKVTYELLNADVWVQQITAIIDKKINQFEITPENRKAVKPSLERMLDTLITQADLNVRKQRQSGTWAQRTKGRLKQGIQDSLVDIKDVKRGIPQYADSMLDELNKPETRRQIQGLLKKILSKVPDSTFALVDQSRLDAIHAQYQCVDRTACEKTIKHALHVNKAQAIWLAMGVLGLTLLLFALARDATGRINNTRLALLTLSCAVLMLCGVLTPMIEVDARISQLRFMLLDEPVIFTDQVLYFQSKSVLDVVRILMTTAAPDMILIGVLIMLFSVVFPLAKLAASFVYLYDLRSLRQSGIVQFFALKSGKWSMADVFVVAMFMAYIGFNGLISSQLSSFAHSGADVDILTTNGTSLQIGFFMFVAFCLASMMTSTLIEAEISQRKTMA